MRCKSTAMTHDRELNFGAKMMIARHALMAVHAAAGTPANPDALSDFDAFRS
jgi:hypothetical protein